MDIDPTTIAPDVPRFLVLVRSIPWLTRLGKPHPRDGEVVRITDWRGWPGPERGFADMFGRWPAFVMESIDTLPYHLVPAVLDCAPRRRYRKVAGFDAHRRRRRASPFA